MGFGIQRGDAAAGLISQTIPISQAGPISQNGPGLDNRPQIPIQANFIGKMGPKSPLVPVISAYSWLFLISLLLLPLSLAG